MNRITMPAAVSALALLAACNSGTANNSAPANVAGTTNSSAGTAPSVTPAPGPAPAVTGSVDQTFIVGHWSPNPACDETISFDADGTARVSDDPRPGRWALSGETLTVTPPEGAPQPTQVARAGDNLVATQSGRPMTLNRCQAPAAQATKG